VKTKPIVTETSANLQVALKKYVKEEISGLKDIIKQAIAELAGEGSGIDIQALLKQELKGDPNDIASRDTYVSATDGTFNPAAENTQKKLAQSEMEKNGYVDPDAKARKEFFRKKNGG
jgi:hypothetical protein